MDGEELAEQDMLRFETLFTLLAYPRVWTQRFRMFGCATFNDDVLKLFRSLACALQGCARFR